MTRALMLLGAIAVGLMALTFAPDVASAQTFPGLRITGTLSDLQGEPREGLTTVTVLIHSAPVGGSPLYSEMFTTVVTAGVVDIVLGIGTGTPTGDLIKALHPAVERYVSLQVEADLVEMTP